tara:strand:- start:692 stop:886 length:195 start_codon:yes stop_codon:yes gene_type:complete
VPAVLQEFLVGAAFLDLAFGDNKDAVGATDSAQAVGDRKTDEPIEHEGRESSLKFPVNDQLRED